MSDDLQDFLRRAAQRRKAKAQGASQATPRQRQKPQYSNARTERVTREVQDEAITQHSGNDNYARRVAQIEQAREEAARAEAEAAKQMEKVKKTQKRKAMRAAIAAKGNPVDDILKMLRQPNGLRQAMLIREILDRRW